MTRPDAWIAIMLASLPVPLAAQAPLPDIAPVPSGYPVRHESPRILIVGHEGEASAADLDRYAARLTAWAHRIRAALGPDRAPDVRPVVVLDGSGSGSANGGGSRIPHVNAAGIVFLYYYRPDRSDYLESAAHELVHAYRRAAGTPYIGFAEEGMAQAVTLQISPDGGGFPRYGYPLHVVSGHLIAEGVDLPMREVWRRNRIYTQRCAIHSYAQRESFFAFLSDRFGLDAVIDFVYDGRPNVASGWELHFGATFDALAAEWREITLEQFRADATAPEQAHRYRSQSPAQFQRFCEDSR